MFLIKFGATGFGYHKGWELGDKRNAEISVLRLLFVQIVKIKPKSNLFCWFSDIVEGYENATYLESVKQEIEKHKEEYYKKIKEYREQKDIEFLEKRVELLKYHDKLDALINNQNNMRYALRNQGVIMKDFAKNFDESFSQLIEDSEYPEK